MARQRTCLIRVETQHRFVGTKLKENIALAKRTSFTKATGQIVRKKERVLNGHHAVGPHLLELGQELVPTDANYVLRKVKDISVKSIKQANMRLPSKVFKQVSPHVLTSHSNIKL